MRVSITNAKLTKTSILPRRPGVYKITNQTNGNFYIGSAANLHLRKQVHFSKLRKGTHHNLYLQNAYNLAGVKVFTFEILDLCDKEDLLTEEQKHLDGAFDHQKKCYNINRKAESWLGRRHTEKSKKKNVCCTQGKGCFTGYKKENVRGPKRKNPLI